ncbi:uncharacterized protein LOC126901437 [Daktulosphaira vitifoliae]|uniref:uncharacterized protein LOC126901437 n=1 Tax=Daktulosphaira vitifoliae TaxID=58002 RepID=UPI0021A99CC3|nr:uncharacterized protein LOC126901437 [Daktulosphaira vitifoliae]
MRFSCSVVLAVAVLPYCLNAAVVSGRQNQITEGDREGRSINDGNWALVTKISEECAKDQDTTACLAVKAAAAFERAARLGDVQVFPGVMLAKNSVDSQRDSRALPTEEELRGQLPEDAEEKTSKVTGMVVDSALRFLQSRTLQLQFPQTNAEELSRAIEEGRGKLKKKVLPIVGLLAVKIFAILPVLLGIIGFFALKALVFGKLALLIAGVLALQKFAGSSSGFGKIAEGWSGASAGASWPSSGSPSNGGYYRRSMEAQQMAYNGQLQPSVVSPTSA